MLSAQDRHTATVVCVHNTQRQHTSCSKAELGLFSRECVVIFLMQRRFGGRGGGLISWYVMTVEVTLLSTKPCFHSAGMTVAFVRGRTVGVFFFSRLQRPIYGLEQNNKTGAANVSNSR